MPLRLAPSFREQLADSDRSLVGMWVCSGSPLLAEVDGLWRTSPLRSTKPSPLDEVRTAMATFDQTLFEVFPEVYRRFDDWLAGDDAAYISGAVIPVDGGLGMGH